jgi:hypothetical protein
MQRQTFWVHNAITTITDHGDLSFQVRGRFMVKLFLGS